MKCKRCEIEFVPSKGLRNYCSLSCRNKRVHTEKTKKKISNSIKMHFEKYGTRIYSEKEIKDTLKKYRQTIEKRLLEEPFENLSFERLRKRVILEQNNKCNNCKINNWLGEKLTLELDHKDGNSKNNNRDNLEAVCPNCHSLTPTWRGRNKKNKGLQKITDEKLLTTIIKHNFNLRQALLEVGLAAKGGNYKRCHKLVKLLQF